MDITFTTQYTNFIKINTDPVADLSVSPRKKGVVGDTSSCSFVLLLFLLVFRTSQPLH